MSKINMVRHEGGSRVLSVSRVIPKTWIAVEMEVVKESKSIIVVKIIKVR